MKFSKKILETFVDLPADWRELMEDVGLEVKSVDGDIMNLELLANRGDHYCYLGLATEINGRAGTGVKQLQEKGLKYENAKRFVIDTDKCIAYSFVPFDIKSIKPAKADYILESSGVNVIHPAIDVTNVVMLEYGQPAHVYDADKIVGQVHIRETKVGEKAALLFHEGLTELPAGTVVIADDEKILCVAGVIGCHGAGVDENTKNVLLETALFDPVSIRKTAKELGVCTIASQRFERGGNLDAVKSGAERANYLYEQISANQNGDAEFSQRVKLPVKEIQMSCDFVRNELEIDISDKEINERLSRYGFIISDKKYIVPNVRTWDIKGFKADLIEELARSIGYNNLPNRLPMAQIGSEPTPNELRKTKINSYLVNNGFFEVFTDNLYSPKHAKLSPVPEHVKIENSIEGGYAFMKNNCIVQAVELVSKNLRVKNREIRAFEWSKVFDFDKKGIPRETNMLWGIVNGNKESALTVKGLLENLFENLGLDVRFEYNIEKPEEEDNFLMPKRRGQIYYTPTDALMGSFGEVSPGFSEQFDIKNEHPIYFVLNTDALLIAPKKKTKYESPSNLIASVRDISVSIPYGVSAGSVAGFIAKNYKVIADVKITDVFEKPKESLRNITFALEFKGTQSTEELNTLILEIMNSANEFAKK
ncbi:MAG: phenylalanine--tRNA ligase subunit beta [Alphaproteobacteria bacterium]|nr:phenylalanine--tRNA ligase subunit beta [Alphaproteobacteria bacterium]